jgi:hypothetical protein
MILNPFFQFRVQPFRFLHCPFIAEDITWLVPHADDLSAIVHRHEVKDVRDCCTSCNPLIHARSIP